MPELALPEEPTAEETPTDPPLAELVKVDPDELTIAEVEIVEEMSGMSIDTFSRPGTPKAKFMRAMGYVKKRRGNPNFTWDQSGAVRVRMDSSSSVPPTSGNGSDPSQSLPTSSV